MYIIFQKVDLIDIFLLEHPWVIILASIFPDGCGTFTYFLPGHPWVSVLASTFLDGCGNFTYFFGSFVVKPVTNFHPH